MAVKIGNESQVVRVVVEGFCARPELGGLLGQVGKGDGCFVLGDFGAEGVGSVSYFGPGAAGVFEYREGDAGDPLGLLDDCVRKYRVAEGGEVPVPFVGGWVGYLSYDLGRYIEKLPDEVEHDVDLPLWRFGFYDHVIAWDHVHNRGYLLVLEYEGQASSVSERLERLRAAAAVEEEAAKQKAGLVDVGAGLAALEQMEGNIAPADYLLKVQRAREYIKAGDIYEVNLAQRFGCAFTSDPTKLYAALTRENPASYSGLLRWDEAAVVSVSPELFLQKRGRQIVTRPIKGTIGRGATAAEDERNRAALYASEKERAELNMIIDLERNDLGRVCEIGSVAVVVERAIEAHPTLYHAVATVAGVLRQEVGVSDVLRATFPGGSITGAPKIRAMEIIDELEPTARGVYTGSIGWFGVNGDFDLNIAIRTIVIAGGKATFQAGGAVVDDSTAIGEYEETLTKAAALARALKGKG